MAAFPVDGDKAPGCSARRGAPGAALGGRGLLVVTVVDYRRPTSASTSSTPSPSPARGAAGAAVAAGLRSARYGTGQFVVDLPVSSEVSVKGGKGIWGMPKHQANLDFTITTSSVSSQYDVDGQLGAYVEIERPAATGTAAGRRRRQLLRVPRHGDERCIYFQGAADIALGRRARHAACSATTARRGAARARHRSRPDLHRVPSATARRARRPLRVLVLAAGTGRGQDGEGLETVVGSAMARNGCSRRAATRLQRQRGLTACHGCSCSTRVPADVRLDLHRHRGVAACSSSFRSSPS